MQFLRTIFWVALAVIAVVFGFNNWTPVSVRLWSDLVLDTRLPMAMLVAFLAGLLPILILHRATRWSLRRKLDAAQRTIVETQPAAVEPAAPRPPPPPVLP